MHYDNCLNLLRTIGLCWILTIGLIAPLETAWAEVQKPEQAIEGFIKAIRAMDFPIKDQSRHANLVEQADSYLDLDAMGQRALAAHWAQATSDEQKNFFDLMWKLIETIAYSRSRKFMGDFEVLYPEVKQAGDHYEVHSVIKQQEEDLDAKVVYSVYQKNGQWKIDDVILDDVSITEDLKYQFDKIIAQSRFAGLLDKMRERLAQAETENNAPAA